MKESTCLRIFHNWRHGQDTVLSKYKYSILFAPLMNTWYFIRADKNGEDWDWYKPCPDYICQLIYSRYEPKSLHPDTIVGEALEEGYSGLFEEEKTNENN